MHEKEGNGRSGAEPSPSPSLEKGGEQVAAVASGKAKKKHRISPKTKRARSLRNNATGAEKLLWTKLNRRQIGGYKFRRQHPLGPFILDFYCVDLKYCIELDGDHHGREPVRLKDERRSQYLAAQGVTVSRFWNNDIFDNLDGVVETIFSEAGALARVALTLKGA